MSIRVFCSRFVIDMFNKHDTDANGILDRTELNTWIQNDLKERTFLSKSVRTKNFEAFVIEADTNGDNQIDRWELFQYCMANTD